MNVSATSDKEEVPWRHFFGQSGYEMVNLHEGGYYLSKGIWRPEETSCMGWQFVPYFNGPSRELIVKRIKSLAGEPYSWEEFLINDKYESAEALFSKIPPVHHAPVILP